MELIKTFWPIALGFIGGIVLPVGGFVWMLFTRQQSHHTDIEVLKARLEAIE